MQKFSYNPTTRLEKLEERKISKAQAEQRKGRVGRTQPGECFRLYSKDSYRRLQPYQTPEIQRANLTSVVLQLCALGITDIEQFPFVDPPSLEAIRYAIKELRELNAIDAHNRLTSFGTKVISHIIIIFFPG